MHLYSAQTKVTERVSVLQKKGGNYTCIIKYKLQDKNEYTIKYESKNVRQTKFKHQSCKCQSSQLMNQYVSIKHKPFCN